MGHKEVIVITAEGCPGCRELVQNLEKDNRNFRVLDVTKSLEAARIVRDLGIMKVPAIVTLEKTEHGTEICASDGEEKAKCVKVSEDGS